MKEGDRFFKNIEMTNVLAHRYISRCDICGYWIHVLYIEPVTAHGNTGFLEIDMIIRVTGKWEIPASRFVRESIVLSSNLPRFIWGPCVCEPMQCNVSCSRSIPKPWLVFVSPCGLICSRKEQKNKERESVCTGMMSVSSLFASPATTLSHPQSIVVCLLILAPLSICNYHIHAHR